MPGLSFKLEGEIFHGVKIVTTGDVDVEEIDFDPNRGVCCAIIGFNIDG